MILWKHVYNLLCIIIILVLDINLSFYHYKYSLDMHDNYTASMKIINGQNLSDYQSSIVNNLSTLIVDKLSACSGRLLLTYNTHIHNISVQAHEPLQIIKALTATGWGKQKETLMATYKVYDRLLHPRPALTNKSHAELSIENCHRMHTRHKNTSEWRNTHTPHTQTPTAPLQNTSITTMPPL